MRNYHWILAVSLYVILFFESYSKATAPFAHEINKSDFCDWDSIPGRYMPSPGSELTYQNFTLNDRYPFFVDFGLRFNKDEIDIESLKETMDTFEGGTNNKGFDILMKIADVHPQAARYLYSRSDAPYPVILLSALSNVVKIKLLQMPDEKLNFDVLSLTVPDASGQWRSLSKKEKGIYILECKDDVVTLQIPENKSKDFRRVALSVYIDNIDKSGVSTVENKMICRSWIFVQLPWTNDPKVFNYVPITSMHDYIKGNKALQKKLKKLSKDSSYVADALNQDVSPKIFSQTACLMRNHVINDMIVTFPYLPDRLGLLLSQMKQSSNSVVRTYMHITGLPEWCSIVTSTDGFNPIILISALGATVKWNVDFQEYSKEDNYGDFMLWNFKILGPDKEWIDATESEKESLLFSHDSLKEEFTLTLPENKTPDFRCVLIEIINQRSVEFNHLYPARKWYFVQLPWTDDPEIFHHLPVKIHN